MHQDCRPLASSVVKTHCHLSKQTLCLPPVSHAVLKKRSLDNKQKTEKKRGERQVQTNTHAKVKWLWLYFVEMHACVKTRCKATDEETEIPMHKRLTTNYYNGWLSHAGAKTNACHHHIAFAKVPQKIEEENTTQCMHTGTHVIPILQYHTVCCQEEVEHKNTIGKWCSSSSSNQCSQKLWLFFVVVEQRGLLARDGQRAWAVGAGELAKCDPELAAWVAVGTLLPQHGWP